MRLIALCANLTVFTWLLAGCGDYDADDPAGGGDAGTTSDTDTDTDTDTDSDADSDADCADVTPCGGDVVGAWNVTSSCLTVSGALDMTALGLGETCNATVTGSLAVTGTWTANADGTTYSDGTTVSGTETMELTEDCKSLSGTITTCDRIGGPLAAAGYASCTCVDNTATSGCTCTATIEQAGGIGVAPGYPRASGNYTIAGNLLTVTAGTQEYSYCVSGTALTMTPVSAAVTGTVTGAVELQRQ